MLKCLREGNTFFEENPHEFDFYNQLFGRESTTLVYKEIICLPANSRINLITDSKDIFVVTH